MAEMVVPQELLDATEIKNIISENPIFNKFPELNEVELIKTNALFAETCTVSIRGLIKIIPLELNQTEISFKVNDSQDMIIGDMRIQWQNFIRKHFDKPEINLNFVIDNSIEHKRMAYTAPEQLSEMLENNDKLKLLIDKFKLRIKY